MKINSRHTALVELLVALIPFVLMALVLLGLWLFTKRRGGPVRPRWGLAAAVACAVLAAGTALGPDGMSSTERLLTFLPAAAFVLLVLPTIEAVRRMTKRQGD